MSEYFAFQDDKRNTEHNKRKKISSFSYFLRNKKKEENELTIAHARLHCCSFVVCAFGWHDNNVEKKRNVSQ